MGVMQCSRNGCLNIMCDTYIPMIGYICEECKAEFKYFFEHHGKIFAPPHNIEITLKSFMKGNKSCMDRRNLQIDVDSYFKIFSKNE